MRSLLGIEEEREKVFLLNASSVTFAGDLQELSGVVLVILRTCSSLCGTLFSSGTIHFSSGSDIFLSFISTYLLI